MTPLHPLHPPSLVEKGVERVERATGGTGIGFAVWSSIRAGGMGWNRVIGHKSIPAFKHPYFDGHRTVTTASTTPSGSPPPIAEHESLILQRSGLISHSGPDFSPCHSPIWPGAASPRLQARRGRALSAVRRHRRPSGAL